MVKNTIAIIIFFGSLSLWAQKISVSASTDTTDYYIGDFITYTLKAEYDKDVKIYPPDLKELIHNVEFIRAEAPATKISGGKKVTDFTVVLSRYDSAEVMIPQIPIYYRAGKDTLIERAPVYLDKDTLIKDETLQQALSNQVVFTVHRFEISEAEDIKDVKYPIRIPPDWKIIVLILLGAIILLVLLYLIYKKHLRKKPLQPAEIKVKKVQPHISALNALKHLDEKQLWQKGFIKEYHSEITEIIRRYYEERFNLPALELTTSEIIERLNSRKDFEIILALTENFLNNADLVKFAKYKPMDEVNIEMMNQAIEIVEKTKQKDETALEVQNV
jgi:hypothetical protein